MDISKTTNTTGLFNDIYELGYIIHVDYFWSFRFLDISKTIGSPNDIKYMIL